MTGHFAVAIIVLCYLALPLVAYLVYWVWKKLRRGAGDAEGETDA